MALLATGAIASITPSCAQTTLLPTDVTRPFSGGLNANSIMNNYSNQPEYSNYRSAYTNSDNTRIHNSGYSAVVRERGLFERMFDSDKDTVYWILR